MKYLNNRRHLDYALIKIPLIKIYMAPVPKIQSLLRNNNIQPMYFTVQLNQIFISLWPSLD